MEAQLNGLANNNNLNGLTAQTSECKETQMKYMGDDAWEEVTIEVPWGKVEGKWWGDRNKQPIIALHGWQDNCGTFDRLCPLMPANMPVLCLDLPGHGKSSPYPKGMQYYLFWDGILLIRRIVRKFGWTKVTLMGHSLGGALTFMYASIYPQDMHKLINIDIAGPTIRDQEELAERSAVALDKFLDYETLAQNKMPHYTADEAYKLVLDAYGGSVDEQCVKILMKRGMINAAPIDGEQGFHFARDIRLKVSVLAMLTKEQVLLYARRICCKVLNIRALPGMHYMNPEVYDDVIDELKKNAELVIYEKVPGTHHLHLVTPDRVAPIINNFLLKY